MDKSSKPIGIFDSGIGGMTLAKAIKEIMPNESLVYFGDTAHLPYGDKSAAAIQAYSIKICNMLLARECKVILIACNSASAAAYELVKEYVGSKAKVINVIDPVVHYVGQQSDINKLGVIGTKQTIGSNVYQRRIDELNKGVECVSLATPLLAPMIEEGFFDNKISHDIISVYLSSQELTGIDNIILGCTHYPLIKNEISAYYNDKVKVVDSSQIVAQEVYNYLEANQLVSSSKPKDVFFVSDYTESFKQSTELFFGSEVQLELYKLWE